MLRPALSCVSAAASAAQRVTVPTISAAVRQLHSAPNALSASTAAEVNKPSAVGHWKAERILSVGLVSLVPIAYAFPCQAVDMAIATALPLHNYWGMGQIITDYVHGDATKIAANGLNLAMCTGSCAGMIYFNLNDVGVVEAIKQLWHL
eukprot:m.43699 g.43699  ORF g.43699 m.43699 type:complete len:149 (-) comp12250_c0_seq1:288-734(-)